MKTDSAKEMYQQFLQKLGKSYDPVKIQGTISYFTSFIVFITYAIYYTDGVFGAMMLVDIVNDGKLELFNQKFIENELNLVY